MKYVLVPLLMLASAAAAPAQAPLQQRIEAQLAEASPAARFGLVVATEQGEELIAIAPEQRFIPASNTKMFTTAAAFATLTGLDRPDTQAGAAVRLEDEDVVLHGRGDARLSSAPGCIANCLAALADAVAARTRVVDDVVGDDSLFPDQRWSPGMSWNNIPTRSGTATSALTLDDNELVLRIIPGAPGAAPKVESLAYYKIDNRAITVTGSESDLSYDRLPGSRVLRLGGTIAAGAEPEILRIAIDDPAHYAAWRMKALLEARGVRVTGDTLARHRPAGPADDPDRRGTAPPMRAPEPQMLATLAPPPLSEDLRLTNKVSQNLHAELLLRRVGRVAGTGSIADGVAAIGAMLERGGLESDDYSFSDGSGMSTYNRVAPRGMVRFLKWAAAQPWGAEWREGFPVAGVDGTLARRFRGTPLEGKLFAKTGTLNATNALSGYMIAASGRTLLFSTFANDVPEGIAATRAVDEALLAIAAAN